MAYIHFQSGLDHFLVFEGRQGYFTVVVHCTLPRSLLEFFLDESGINRGAHLLGLKIFSLRTRAKLEGSFGII